MDLRPDNILTSIDRLRDFLRDLIGSDRPYATAKDMAEALNLAQGRASILYKFLKGAEPRAGVVLEWLERLGISIIYPDEGGKQEEVEFIPVLSCKASAGGGYDADADGAYYEAIRAMSADFFRKRHLDPGRCRFVPIVGDSMEPVIADGSTVLMEETSQYNFFLESDRLYIVRHQGLLRAKRVVFGDDRTTLYSYNELYPPVVIMQDDESEDFEVLGRIRWYSSDV